MSKIPIRPFSFITIVFLLMFPAKGTARVHHVDRIGNDANQKVLPAGAAVISGTVTDAGGEEAVPQARIVLTSAGSEIVRALTDERGQYELIVYLVSPEFYSLFATDNYFEAEKLNVKLSPGERQTRDLWLFHPAYRPTPLRGGPSRARSRSHRIHGGVGIPPPHIIRHKDVLIELVHEDTR